jgi:hypothetical protein
MAATWSSLTRFERPPKRFLPTTVSHRLVQRESLCRPPRHLVKLAASPSARGHRCLGAQVRGASGPPALSGTTWTRPDRRGQLQIDPDLASLQQLACEHPSLRLSKTPLRLLFFRHYPPRVSSRAHPILLGWCPSPRVAAQVRVP